MANEELFTCRFCHSEVAQVGKKDKDGNGLCGVCMETVPAEWDEYANKDHRDLIILAAINYGTNQVLGDVERLRGEVQSLAVVMAGLKS